MTGLTYALVVINAACAAFNTALFAYTDNALHAGGAVFNAMAALILLIAAKK